MKYIEQPGISYTEYEVETREDSGRSYPVVMPKDFISILIDKIATISNIPATQEIQGLPSESFPLDSPILGGSAVLNGSLKLTGGSYITAANSQNITFKQFDERTIMEITDAGVVHLSNGATGPGELRFYEDTDLGTHYTGFKAGNATESISYILPVADGNANEVLTTNGSGTLTWSADSAHPDPHRIADGGTSAPAYSFSGDTNTGMYRSASDTISFTAGNSDALYITNAGITLIAGSASAPSYTFSGDTNTGIYHVGADQVGITTGGALRITIADGAISPAVPLISAVGAESAPTYSFTGDTNTGVYRVGADNIGITTGGTLRVSIDDDGIDVLAGSESAPTYGFTADTDTGMYRAGGDSLGFTAGGAGHTWTAQDDGSTYRMIMSPIGDRDGTAGDPFFYIGVNDDFTANAPITSTQSYYFGIGTGSVSAPSIFVTGDTNTGIYSSGADTLHVTTGGSARMTWDSSGTKMESYGVGTGTDVVHTSGQLKSKSSSRRYKEDILDLQNIKSEDVYKLRPVSFKWKGNKQEDFGFIAEEVAEVIPKLVHYQEDKPESVAYDKLSVLLLLEISKLKEEIRELKEKV